MIDPSLMLAEYSIDNTFNLAERLSKWDKDIRFYYPVSLKRFLNMYEWNEGKPGIGFFLQNAHPSHPGKLFELIDTFSSIVHPFEPTPEHREKYAEIYTKMTGELRYRHELYAEALRDMLFEEFIFLQEQSFMVSRIKKPFNTFESAGAAYVQFSKGVVDRLVRITLKNKKQDDLIRNVDRLRAFGKWIAVGGLSVSRMITPEIADILISLALGYFLLFDPKTA
jgi:hypothetical protein